MNWSRTLASRRSPNVNAVVKAVRPASHDGRTLDGLDVVVGKDVLELITGAMYVDPLTIFREYLQNAADSIDQARLAGLYSKATPRVDILLDLASRSIVIRDTGTGVPATDFWRCITSIGASAKRGEKQRGFRGIGRLSGLGYGSELIFRTRFSGERQVSQICWSARRFRELLLDASYDGGLATLVKDVVTSQSFEADDSTPPHFFEVQLKGVVRIGNDVLLNPDEVAAYLSQHGPVPFSPSFKFSSKIDEFLRHHGIPEPVAVHINDQEEPIFRSIDNVLHTRGKESDDILGVELIEIPSLNGETLDAIGWVAHHSYQGAIRRTAGYGGIRGRVGNIQVGGHQLIESLFLENRFNSWCIGEFHVVSSKIVPNGRRDDFEVNAHFQNMIGHLAGLATRLSKLCREMSIQRNRLKRADSLRKLIEEKLLVLRDPSAPILLKEHFRTLVMKDLGELGRIAADNGIGEKDQSSVARIVAKLKRDFESIKPPRPNDQAMAFLPKAKRNTFLETIRLVIASCDTPEQAAAITRRVFDKARRRYRA